MKLILAMLVNLVSLQQSHHKHMGISSDGHPSVTSFNSLGLEDHHLFPYVCDGIAAMKQGLQAWLRWASRTPRGGLKSKLNSMFSRDVSLEVIQGGVSFNPSKNQSKWPKGLVSKINTGWPQNESDSSKFFFHFGLPLFVSLFVAAALHDGNTRCDDEHIDGKEIIGVMSQAFAPATEDRY